MTNKIKLGLALIVIIAIAIGWFLPLGSSNTTIIEKLGSVAGPDSYLPYMANNDVKVYSHNQALAKGTTTPCAIKSPSATSTLLNASLRITTASSTATTWTVAKATTAYATTTSLGSSIALASGAQGTMTASTTFNGLADDTQIIAPNQWIVWGVAGIGNLTTDKLLGKCSAQFLEF